MCKIKSHWMFSVVFFMFYICVICDCVCVLKYAIYLIWPRQFSFGPCFFNLAHTLARTKNEPEGTLKVMYVTLPVNSDWIGDIQTVFSDLLLMLQKLFWENVPHQTQ